MVINSTLAGVIREARLHEEIGEIYSMSAGIQGLLDEEIYDLRRQPPDLVESLQRTPGSALSTCRYRVKPDEYERILQILKAHDIRYFLYIGGNDSADTSAQIARVVEADGYEMRVIGLPKTIDNDLPHTNHCPGYGSVARYIAISTMEAGADIRSQRSFTPIDFIETMGRDTGWIAAAAALGKRREADPPHLVYVPERPVRLEELLEDVQGVYNRYGYAVVVVSEGLRNEEGHTLVESSGALEVDAFGHRQRGGVGEYLARMAMERLGIKARAEKPGVLQRATISLASRVDIQEAVMLGAAGVRYALQGISGQLVILVREPGPQYSCRPGLVPLEQAANGVKRLPDEFMDYENHLPTQQFHEYAMPLIGDPLPQFALLREARVEKLLPPR